MTQLVLCQGDITTQDVDAIVNAANSTLLGGGGVDGAIHRAGGPEILEACRAIRARQGGCREGEAVITPGGRLSARFVIHTVGPVWGGGKRGEPETLAACYRHSLQIAVDQGLRSIAFPCISTGVFGYPGELAAPVAVATVREFTEAYDVLTEVRFVVFSDADRRIYAKILGFPTSTGKG